MKKKLMLNQVKVHSFTTKPASLKGGITGTCKTIEMTCEPCTGWWCPTDPEQC